MTDRLFVQPPEIVETDRPVIFLAGPIQGGPNWHPEAATYIHDRDPRIIVASPRKDYERGTFIYNEQVDWETHFLRTAGRTGVVAFWLAVEQREKLAITQRLKVASQIMRTGLLPPVRSYAQTTRFELGEWKMAHQHQGAPLTIGIENGFGNERYIRRRMSQDCPDVKIANSLEQMCQNAVDLVHAGSQQ